MFMGFRAYREYSKEFTSSGCGAQGLGHGIV